MELVQNERFLVSSAYFAEWHNQYGHKISGENTVGPSRNSPIWATIWSLSCPAKVKSFLWPTLLGSLACRETLANRNIKVSGQCPTCGIGAKDTKHLLFTCAKAKEVWRLLSLDFAIDKACALDHAGEVVLEYLILEPAKECVVLDLGNSTEAIVVGS
jgi:hypothetical protein